MSKWKRAAAVTVVAAGLMAGSGVALAQTPAPAATAASAGSEQCTYSYSGGATYFQARCTRLPVGFTQYRAIAYCANGTTAYGGWKTVAGSRYIGSVAYCSSRVSWGEVGFGW